MGVVLGMEGLACDLQVLAYPLSLLIKAGEHMHSVGTRALSTVISPCPMVISA